MSYENAKANLKELEKDLKRNDSRMVDELVFDENHTCILGIDNAFSLHITYEPHSDRLYLYSPVLDGLPRETTIKLKLYEHLLSGSMLGAQMAGGGVGVATKEELILMHAVLEMGIGADAHLLSRFTPVFVSTVERWRKKAKDISEGREPEEDDISLAQNGIAQNPMAHNANPSTVTHSIPPQRQPFIKG
ncbi:MAG: CesT family type III secretion system chaperone [Candidatus Rhabdochlamydia sp.]